MLSKLQLRKQIKAELKPWCPEGTQSLGENLYEFISGIGNAIWGSYKARSTEADPSAAEKRLDIISWAYPKVEGAHLVFYISKNQEFVSGYAGIMEPNIEKSTKSDLSNFKGVLVPGLAFDKSGGRLGSGKGFYDRALEGFNGLKVGLAGSWQVLDSLIPQSANDVQMDFIVTEKKVIRCKER